MGQVSQREERDVDGREWVVRGAAARKHVVGALNVARIRRRASDYRPGERAANAGSRSIISHAPVATTLLRCAGLWAISTASAAS